MKNSISIIKYKLSTLLTLFCLTTFAYCSEVELVNTPAAFTGKSVVIEKIRCIDPLTEGFVCAKVTDNKVLVVKAKRLGPNSVMGVELRLYNECRGSEKLNNFYCDFDLAVTPIQDGVIDTVMMNGSRWPRTTIEVDELVIKRVINLFH